MVWVAWAFSAVPRGRPPNKSRAGELLALGALGKQHVTVLPSTTHASSSTDLLTRLCSPPAMHTRNKQTRKLTNQYTWPLLVLLVKIDTWSHNLDDINPKFRAGKVIETQRHSELFMSDS